MSTIQEITAMCKAGRLQEAYELSQTDLAADPENLWVQRAAAWPIYYMIRQDAETGNFQELTAHLDKLRELTLLTPEQDAMVFENVLWKVAEYVKNRIAPTDFDAPARLSALFERLRSYTFQASKAHSTLLSHILHHGTWEGMDDFLEWWNLDTLTPEDYAPYVNPQGKKTMTLAERTFIAYAKVLLRKGDATRIEEFLPRLDALMQHHPEMTYTGYFYGKLLLALGDNAEEALKVLIPFARKKMTEFWVWQLLSDVFAQDAERHLACLLRAVHCRTQETFLGKVRIRLTTALIRRGDLNRARHQVDTVVRCYVSHGWRLPYEIDYWIHQPWLTAATPDASAPIDYMAITDAILCEGATECFAVVTYVDERTHRASLIYGHEQRMNQKLRLRVAPGHVLRIHYVTDADGRPKVLTAAKALLPADLAYAKKLEGTIDKRPDRDFAFFQAGGVSAFVPPTLVARCGVRHGDSVTALLVYDYDRRKDKWNWVCANLLKR